jgi:hypothetical protein
MNKLTEEDLIDYRLKEELKKQIDKKIQKFGLPSPLMVEMLEELINLYKN